MHQFEDFGEGKNLLKSVKEIFKEIPHVHKLKNKKISQRHAIITTDSLISGGISDYRKK